MNIHRLVIIVVATLSIAASGVTFALVGGAAAKVPFFAIMTGGNEVSGTGQGNAGDPNGTGSATVYIFPAAGKLCFTLSVFGLDTPTAAHIHNQRAGKNGDIVVNL